MGHSPGSAVANFVVESAARFVVAVVCSFEAALPDWLVDIGQSVVFAFAVVRLLVAATLMTDSDKTAPLVFDSGNLVD